MSNETKERNELIAELLDSPVDPHPILQLLLRHRGPGALTTEALRQAREVQRALAPRPETPADGLLV